MLCITETIYIIIMEEMFEIRCIDISANDSKILFHSYFNVYMLGHFHLLRGKSRLSTCMTLFRDDYKAFVSSDSTEFKTVNTTFQSCDMITS